MGVSIHANIVVGVEIRHTDFWAQTSRKSDKPECPNGHPGKKGKFCEECGKKVAIQTHTSSGITQNFAKFCKNRKLRPEEVVDPDPKPPLRHSVEAPLLGDVDLILDVVPGDLHWGSEEPVKRWVLGRELAATDDILEGARGDIIPETELKETFENVRAIANELGIDRPVQLYFTTSYC